MKKNIFITVIHVKPLFECLQAMRSLRAVSSATHTVRSRDCTPGHGALYAHMGQLRARKQVNHPLKHTVEGIFHTFLDGGCRSRADIVHHARQPWWGCKIRTALTHRLDPQTPNDKRHVTPPTQCHHDTNACWYSARWLSQVQPTRGPQLPLCVVGGREDLVALESIVPRHTVSVRLIDGRKELYNSCRRRVHE